jgi:hypothetical protein
MFLRQAVESDNEATRLFAIRICCEVYERGENEGLSWLPIPSIAFELKSDFEDTFAALKYAVRMGWLETKGNPANVKLLQPGYSMVVGCQFDTKPHGATTTKKE